jgi:hypothetical protein
MGNRNIVVEIDSFSDPLIYEDFDAMVSEGVIGVLIKVSQGVRWVNPLAPKLVGEALAAGLLVGALHHVETERASLSGQRGFFVSHLPGGVYELGLVLEVEPHNGAELYALATELGDTLTSMESLAPGVGLRCSAETLATLSGAPWAARWWAGSMTDMVSAKPWAEYYSGDVEGMGSTDGGGYILASTRGLNIGGSLDLAPVTVGADPLVALDPAPESGQGPGSADGDDKGAAAIEVPLQAHGETPGADEDDDSPEGDESEPEDWRAKAAAELAR